MEVVKEYTQTNWTQDGTKAIMVPDFNTHSIDGSRRGIYANVYAFDESQKEALANAKLIAAAPKLVEAIIDRAEKAASAYWKECQGHVGVDNEFRPEPNYLQDCWAHHLTEKEIVALKEAGILRD